MRANIDKEGNVDVPEEKSGKEAASIEKGKSFLRQCIEMLIYFVFILSVVFLLQTFVIQPVQVDGESMLMTLSNNDHLLLEKLSYEFNEPKRFDVIVFKYREDEDEKYYIKRIIGLPGETIRINNSVIYINGVALKENFGKDENINNAGIANEDIVIGENQYFVLGDNRNNSKDSRVKSVGLIKKSSILGKAWLRVWPFSKIGIVRHK